MDPQDFLRDLLSSVVPPNLGPAGAAMPQFSGGGPVAAAPGPISAADPAQAVVAQAIQALPQTQAETTPAYGGSAPGPETQGVAPALAQTPQVGAAPATIPAGYDLYAGQGAGGFGQGSVGTETSQPQRRTTAVFK